MIKSKDCVNIRSEENKYLKLGQTFKSVLKIVNQYLGDAIWAYIKLYYDPKGNGNIEDRENNIGEIVSSNSHEENSSLWLSR